MLEETLKNTRDRQEIKFIEHRLINPASLSLTRLKLLHFGYIIEDHSLMKSITQVHKVEGEKEEDNLGR